MKQKDVKHKINEQINQKEVRIVGDNIVNGVYPIDKALKLAFDEGLDLVVVNESTTPVICKIFSYEKFIYEAKKAKKPQKSKPLKEINFTLNIGDNDIKFKVNHIKNFLSKGHKVKTTLSFAGREITYKDRGMEILLKVAVEVEEFGIPENLPTFNEKKLIMFINPIIK